jgi:hypothetical protein
MVFWRWAQNRAIYPMSSGAARWMDGAECPLICGNLSVHSLRPQGAGECSTKSQMFGGGFLAIDESAMRDGTKLRIGQYT